jgi:hypothetical protein
MPSTYTLNNGIELIGTGEQSGTWGDTTNTNFELLDTALDGQVSVTLAATGSSGSPNTLPISDGASSNGRNRLVIFGDGGDLGGTAFVQLTPNDAEKIIYVRNNLSGSRSILLFQGTYNASNDYEVPAGTTAVVFFNGAGAGAVAANVFNNAYFDSLRLGGVSVTAIIDDDTMGTAAATNIATSESIKAYVDAQVGANNELSEVLANGNTTGGTDIAVSANDDITFADSSKAIFGASSDLQIYHDGSDSFITDTGAGNLQIWGGNFRLRSSDGSEAVIDGNSGGAVTLYYDNAPKLATTSTGVDITGTLTSDGLTVDGDGEFNNTSSASGGKIYLDGTTANAGDDVWDLQFRNTVSGVATDENAGSIRVEATNARRQYDMIFARSNSGTQADAMRIGFNGDITFYDTSGNASFVYDESAGSVFNENGDNKDFRVESDDQAHMLFVDASTNRVGINNNVPQAFLHVTSGDATPLGSFRVEQTNASAGGNSWQSLFEDDSSADQGSGNSIIYINSNRPNTSAGKILRVVGNSKSSEYFSIYDTGEVVVNESSLSTGDFRVESDSNTHMLFVDAGSNHVNIGGSTDLSQVLNVHGGVALGTDPTVTWNSNYIKFQTRSGSVPVVELLASAIGNYAPRLDIMDGSGATQHSINGAGDTTFNETGANYDFRVESDSNANMFVVDAGLDQVRVGNAESTKGTGPMVIRHDVNYNTTEYDDQPTLYLQNEQNGSGDSVIVFEGNNGSGSSFRSAIKGGAFGLHLIGSGNNTAGDYAGELQISNNDSSFGNVTINELGRAETDFRVESDSNANMLFVDAGTNEVGIGTSSPDATMQVYGSLTVGKSGVSEDHDLKMWPSTAGRSVMGFRNQDNLMALMSGDPLSTNLFTVTTGGRGSFVGGLTVNENGANAEDFRVESDGNANMLSVDAGANVVRIGSSSTLHSSTVFSFEAADMTQPGENMYIGRVPNSTNNSNGFVQLFDLTYANANNVGCIFSGKMWVQSYTGFSMADFSVTKNYSNDNVHFTVTSTVDGTAGQSGASLQLVTATVGGSSFLGVKKNGGGSGIVYINAMLTGGVNVVTVKEIASGSYTVTTTHGNIIA